MAVFRALVDPRFWAAVSCHCLVAAGGRRNDSGDAEMTGCMWKPRMPVGTPDVWQHFREPSQWSQPAGPKIRPTNQACSLFFVFVLFLLIRFVFVFCFLPFTFPPVCFLSLPAFCFVHGPFLFSSFSFLLLCFFTCSCLVLV